MMHLYDRDYLPNPGVMAFAKCGQFVGKDYVANVDRFVRLAASQCQCGACYVCRDCAQTDDYAYTMIELLRIE